MISYKDTVELEITYENAVQAVIASRQKYEKYVNRVGLPDRDNVKKWWDLCYGNLGEIGIAQYIREELHIPAVSLDHFRSDTYARQNMNIGADRPLHDQEIDILTFPHFDCRSGVSISSLDSSISVKLSTCPPEDGNRRGTFIERRDFKALHLIKGGVPNDILEDIRSRFLIQGMYSTEVRDWNQRMSPRIGAMLSKPIDRYTAEGLVEASKIMDIGKMCLIGFTTREALVKYNEALPREERLYKMFGKYFWTAKLSALARPLTELRAAMYEEKVMSEVA